jgi:hypothetical protein
MSTFVSRLTGLSEPSVPYARLERVSQVLRRRLDDAVEDVFNRACLNGDLDTASELLEVLKNMHARRQARVGQERRINDQLVLRATAELSRRRQFQSAGRPG